MGVPAEILSVKEFKAFLKDKRQQPIQQGRGSPHSSVPRKGSEGERTRAQPRYDLFGQIDDSRVTTREVVSAVPQRQAMNYVYNKSSLNVREICFRRLD